jgi:hypothetical protein
VKTAYNAISGFALLDCPIVAFQNDPGGDFAAAEKSCFILANYIAVSYRKKRFD